MKISKKAKVITICGSTRFKEEHLREIKRLTLEGNVVLSCPFYNHTDNSDTELTKEHLDLLDHLHKQKIDLSDAIFVVNPGKYIGTSTMNEILYASQRGKEIMYLE